MNAQLAEVINTQGVHTEALSAQLAQVTWITAATAAGSGLLEAALGITRTAR